MYVCVYIYYTYTYARNCMHVYAAFLPCSAGQVLLLDPSPQDLSPTWATGPQRSGAFGPLGKRLPVTKDWTSKTGNKRSCFGANGENVGLLEVAALDPGSRAQMFFWLGDQ